MHLFPQNSFLGAYLRRFTKAYQEGQIAPLDRWRNQIDRGASARLINDILLEWPIGTFVQWEPDDPATLARYADSRYGPKLVAPNANKIILAGASTAFCLMSLTETVEDDGCYHFPWGGDIMCLDPYSRHAHFVHPSQIWTRHCIPLKEIIRSGDNTRGHHEVMQRAYDILHDDDLMVWLFQDVPDLLKTNRIIVVEAKGNDISPILARLQKDDRLLP